MLTRSQHPLGSGSWSPGADLLCPVQWLCTPGKTRCEMHYGMESAGHITGHSAGFTRSLPTLTGTETEPKPCVICPYPHNREPKAAIGTSETYLPSQLPPLVWPPHAQLHPQGPMCQKQSKEQLYSSFAVQALRLLPP